MIKLYKIKGLGIDYMILFISLLFRMNSSYKIFIGILFHCFFIYLFLLFLYFLSIYNKFIAFIFSEICFGSDFSKYIGILLSSVVPEPFIDGIPMPIVVSNLFYIVVLGVIFFNLVYFQKLLTITHKTENIEIYYNICSGLAREKFFFCIGNIKKIKLLFIITFHNIIIHAFIFAAYLFSLYIFDLTVVVLNIFFDTLIPIKLYVPYGQLVWFCTCYAIFLSFLILIYRCFTFLLHEKLLFLRDWFCFFSKKSKIITDFSIFFYVFFLLLFVVLIYFIGFFYDSIEDDFYNKFYIFILLLLLFSLFYVFYKNIIVYIILYFQSKYNIISLKCFRRIDFNFLLFYFKKYSFINIILSFLLTLVIFIHGLYCLLDDKVIFRKKMIFSDDGPLFSYNLGPAKVESLAHRDDLMPVFEEIAHKVHYRNLAKELWDVMSKDVDMIMDRLGLKPVFYPVVTQEINLSLDQGYIYKMKAGIEKARVYQIRAISVMDYNRLSDYNLSIKEDEVVLSCDRRARYCQNAVDVLFNSWNDNKKIWYSNEVSDLLPDTSFGFRPKLTVIVSDKYFKEMLSEAKESLSTRYFDFYQGDKQKVIAQEKQSLSKQFNVFVNYYAQDNLPLNGEMALNLLTLQNNFIKYKDPYVKEIAAQIATIILAQSKYLGDYLFFHHLKEEIGLDLLFELEIDIVTKNFFYEMLYPIPCYIFIILIFYINIIFNFLLMINIILMLNSDFNISKKRYLSIIQLILIFFLPTIVSFSIASLFIALTINLFYQMPINLFFSEDYLSLIFKMIWHITPAMLFFICINLLFCWIYHIIFNRYK